MNIVLNLMNKFRLSVLLPSVLIFCLGTSIGRSVVVINFTEGLAPVDQSHGLSSQYQSTFGVTFLPEPESGNGWTLMGPTPLFPWVDSRGGRNSTTMLMSFTQSINYIIFDAWLQSAGIGGGTVTVTVASLTSANGSVIESTNYLVSNTSAQVWTGSGYAEPAQFNFSPASPFNYVSISTPVKTGIDSFSFSPGYTPGPEPGPSGIPEPGTWATAVLLVGGAAWARWRRRVAA